MDRSHEVVGFGRDQRKRMQQLTVGSLPRVPKTRKREVVAGLKIKIHRYFFAGLTERLIKTAGQYQTMPFPEEMLVRALLRQRLGFGVIHGIAGQLRLKKERRQPPAKQLQRELIAGRNQHRRVLLRVKIVFRLELEIALDAEANLQVGELFRIVFVTAAHASRVIAIVSFLPLPVRSNDQAWLCPLAGFDLSRLAISSDTRGGRTKRRRRAGRIRRSAFHRSIPLEILDRPNSRTFRVLTAISL
jgi:hypothetical protein